MEMIKFFVELKMVLLCTELVCNYIQSKVWDFNVPRSKCSVLCSVLLMHVNSLSENLINEQTSEKWSHPYTHSPGVCHFRLSSLTFFQAQFGEDPNQHHDGHHSTYYVDDHVSAVSIRFLLDIGHRSRRLARVGPHRCVVVGTRRLVQAVDLELAAKSIVAGAAAEQVDSHVTVKRRIPLAHHVVVTPTTAPVWRDFFCFWPRGRKSDLRSTRRSSRPIGVLLTCAGSVGFLTERDVAQQ